MKEKQMTLTKYYRATFTGADEKPDVEVYISDTLEHAMKYAREISMDRHLVSVDEFNTLDDAWTL
jgi:hypothetical protein